MDSEFHEQKISLRFDARIIHARRRHGVRNVGSSWRKLDNKMRIRMPFTIGAVMEAVNELRTRGQTLWQYATDPTTYLGGLTPCPQSFTASMTALIRRMDI